MEPAEGAVKAVVVDAVAEMHRQRLIRPTPQRKIRKRHWQHSSPQVVVGSAVLAVRTSRHQTSSPRRLKTNNIASIGTRRSWCRRIILDCSMPEVIGFSNRSTEATPGQLRWI